MSLAKEYILELIKSGQQAVEHLDNDNILRTLGCLYEVEDRLRASKILLREELKDQKME